MQRLNLPLFHYHIRSVSGKAYLFDPIRAKYVRLTPEEWVRQHMLHYLMDYLHYSPSLITVEAPLRAHQLRNRTDIAVYGRNGELVMIVECKAPSCPLAEPVRTQLMHYNRSQTPFLLFTNGLTHFCFMRHADEGTYQLQKNIPLFETLCQHHVH